MNGDSFNLEELTFTEALTILEMTIDDIELLRSNRLRLQLDNLGIVSKIPIREALDAYFLNVLNPIGITRPLMKSSLDTYKRILEDYYSFATSNDNLWLISGEFEGLTIRYLCSLVQSKKLETTTYNKYVSVMRAFMRFVSFHYRIKISRFPGFFPTKQRLPRALNAKQIRELLHHSKAKAGGIRSHFLIAFCLGTGLRRNEFRLLRVRDIDIHTSMVRVMNGKGQKTRSVPIPSALLAHTMEYLHFYNLSDPDQFVFGNSNNPSIALTNQALDQMVHRLMVKLPEYRKGDPVYGYSMHTLRHTYATYLLLHNVPLRTIAACLGHNSVTTTEMYTQLDTEGLRTLVRPALDGISALLEG